MYIVVITVGIIINGFTQKTIIYGMRTYFRVLPFFLLPAIYGISDWEFKKQLKFLFPFLLLQCPIAVFQRFIQFRGVKSGDVVTGTLGVCSILSMTMIFSIAILFGLYLNKKIGLKFFIMTSLCLFLPTTLNETKAALILFPISFLIPVIIFNAGTVAKKIKNIAKMSIIGVLLLFVFVCVYDTIFTSNRAGGLLEYYTSGDKGSAVQTLYRGTKESELEDAGHVGRVDTLFWAYKFLSDDPLTLLFGIGIGSTMMTRHGSLRGEHDDKLDYGARRLTLTSIFWEMGLAGCLICLTLLFLLFRDALLLKDSDNIFGFFALGWCAVIVMVGFSLLYKNVMHSEVIAYLFPYFSGILAAKARRIRLSR